MKTMIQLLVMSWLFLSKHRWDAMNPGTFWITLCILKHSPTQLPRYSLELARHDLVMRWATYKAARLYVLSSHLSSYHLVRLGIFVFKNYISAINLYSLHSSAKIFHKYKKMRYRWRIRHEKSWKPRGFIQSCILIRGRTSTWMKNSAQSAIASQTKTEMWLPSDTHTWSHARVRRYTAAGGDVLCFAALQS